MNRRELLLGAAALALPAVSVRAAEPTVIRDVVFGEPDGYKLTLDIYQPDGPGPHPVVVCSHGGGGLGGTKEGYQVMGPMLARNGYAAVSINYRLAPQFPYPAAFDDSQRAIRWVRAHAKEYGFNPKRVAALGDSAGGHLVGLIGVRGETRDKSDKELSRYSSRPDAVVGNYGAYELVRMWDIEMAHKPLTGWLGGEPKGREKLYKETSPASMVTSKAPPFLILHGDKDMVNPEEQSHLLHDALRAKGVDSTLVIIPGGGHGWAPDSPQGRQAEAATLEFLARQLKK